MSSQQNQRIDEEVLGFIQGNQVCYYCPHCKLSPRSRKPKLHIHGLGDNDPNNIIKMAHCPTHHVVKIIVN